MKRIKYIGYVDTENNDDEKRHFSPAGANKLLYIANSLANLNFKVEILSASFTTLKKGFFTSKSIEINDNLELKLYFTFGAKNKIKKFFRKYLPINNIFWELIVNTNRSDTIIVYHSLNYMIPIIIAKKIKKFNLVLEVEEIYQDVGEFTNRTRRNEYNFFSIADKYIFATELLEEKINLENKPYIIANGAYKVEKNRDVKFDDNRIHIVYAGTFDPRKGGAFAAVEAAEHLSENYHVHIIGFGSEDEKNMLLKKINDISKKTEATITYDGLLAGDEYIRFIQKCDIGLSTQIPEAVYNETSFPSKILSYMANGLRVVSIRIRAVEMSEIGRSIYYYNEQTPEAIAEAISSIDLNSFYDSRELISKLDVSFEESLRKLLEEKNE